MSGNDSTTPATSAPAATFTASFAMRPSQSAIDANLLLDFTASATKAEPERQATKLADMMGTTKISDDSAGKTA